MVEHQIIFNAIVVLAFVFQVYNYWGLGHNRINRYTWLVVLGCYVITETMIALVHPMYFLYVILNLWGIYQLLRGKDGK